MNIILCGLPRCGKSTIGKMLAEKLQWNFIDVDTHIEKAYQEYQGQTFNCREIYFQKGEQFFRQLEKKEIAKLQNIARNVISVGGGCLLEEDNIVYLQGIGSLIYLHIEPKILWQRFQFQEIPAYLASDNPEEAFYDLAKKRIPSYEKAASYLIKTSYLAEQEVVESLFQEIFKPLFLC